MLMNENAQVTDDHDVLTLTKRQTTIGAAVIIFAGFFSIFIVIGDFDKKVINWYIDKTTN